MFSAAGLVPGSTVEEATQGDSLTPPRGLRAGRLAPCHTTATSPSCWLALLFICGCVLLPESSSDKGTSPVRQRQRQRLLVPFLPESGAESLSVGRPAGLGRAGTLRPAPGRFPGSVPRVSAALLSQRGLGIVLCCARVWGECPWAHSQPLWPEIESRVSLPAVRLGPVGSPLLSHPAP